MTACLSKHRLMWTFKFSSLETILQQTGQFIHEYKERVIPIMRENNITQTTSTVALEFQDKCAKLPACAAVLVVPSSPPTFFSLAK